LENELKKYDYIVATEPWNKAWIIGENTMSSAVKPDQAAKYQEQFENEIKAEGWLKQ
jgi:hypothetical protein